MKLYVSGPISNGGTATDEERQANLERMADVVAALRAEGHDVVSPAELHGDSEPGHQRLTWAEYMRGDLRLLLTCDRIVLMPGWEYSKGARCEWYVAKCLGMDVFWHAMTAVIQ